MLSLTRIMASARRRAWSVGLRRTKKVRRCAVFTPTPGNLENSSINAATGGAISLIPCLYLLFVLYCLTACILEKTRNFDVTCGGAGQALLRFRSLIKGVFGSGHDHHLKLVNIFWIEGFGVNLDTDGFKFAAHCNSYSTTASGTGEEGCFQLLLHFHDFLLHLLEFTHIHRIDCSLLYSLLYFTSGEYQRFSR